MRGIYFFACVLWGCFILVLPSCTYPGDPEIMELYISRIKLGAWDCSKAISLKQNKLYYHECEYGSDSQKASFNKLSKDISSDKLLVDFIQSINIKDLKRLSEAKPKKCSVTKYTYSIEVYDELGKNNSYQINEVFECEQTSFMDSLHVMFIELESKEW